MITGSTKLLGVIGYPVEHSLSPMMHNAAIAQMGINYLYVPLPVKPENLADAMRGFEAIGLVGFNATIPHKQAIIPLLTSVSDLAQAVGAVNTVCRTEQGWMGTNTDVQGFLAPLQGITRDWANAEVVVLGNGGAARAVVAGCAQLGVGHVHVVGRQLEKVQAFQTSWHESPLKVAISAHGWNAIDALLPNASLIVNTTPIGMYPHGNASPLSQHQLAKLSPGAIAYDLIYTPRPTQFLQDAQAVGAIALDGLEMLVQQGAAALELWTQQPAPVNIMRATLEQHLAQRMGH
ncbi:shikimate dehydrogenase [Leptolyngbya sp. AN02str]|uniref:shikimate dehydrogenase n=1 Tax=Leptolyngbya sp. AN02str TaxID=3423363 RepID=UPI003D3223E2